MIRIQQRYTALGCKRVKKVSLTLYLHCLLISNYFRCVNTEFYFLKIFLIFDFKLRIKYEDKFSTCNYRSHQAF